MITLTVVALCLGAAILMYAAIAPLFADGKPAPGRHRRTAPLRAEDEDTITWLGRIAEDVLPRSTDYDPYDRGQWLPFTWQPQPAYPRAWQAIECRCGRTDGHIGWCNEIPAEPALDPLPARPALPPSRAVRELEPPAPVSAAVISSELAGAGTPDSPWSADEPWTEPFRAVAA